MEDEDYEKPQPPQRPTKLDTKMKLGELRSRNKRNRYNSAIVGKSELEVLKATV